MFRLIFAIAFPIFAFAISESFILGDKDVILPKTIDKINLIGNELRDKTDISVYISISKKALKPDIKSHTNEVADKIANFYTTSSILISLALDIQKISILASSDMQSAFDTDKILNKYIIPFLVGKDKNDLASKYSAGLLNGYAQLSEDLVKDENIVLQNSIYSDSKDLFDIFRFIIYFILLSTVIFFIYIKFKNRK